MLVVARQDQQKIAMGLLSYLPELPNVAAFQRELDWYQQSDTREVLLWQDTKTQHYVAFLGIELAHAAVIVRQVIFSPEIEMVARDALGAVILQALAGRYTGQTIMGTVASQPILTKWRQAEDG
jgi:riboflavin biosynthesis RibT protein